MPKNSKFFLLFKHLQLPTPSDSNVVHITPAESIKVSDNLSKVDFDKILEKRKNLEEYLVPRIGTTLPDGSVVFPLFMDYIPKTNSFYADLLKRAKKEHESELKRIECSFTKSSSEFYINSSGRIEERIVRERPPTFPFFGYN